jgi:hypothetical protein
MNKDKLIDEQRQLIRFLICHIENGFDYKKNVPKMSAEEVLQILDIDLYDHEIPNIVKAMMLYANQFKQ